MTRVAKRGRPYTSNSMNLEDYIVGFKVCTLGANDTEKIAANCLKQKATFSLPFFLSSETSTWLMHNYYIMHNFKKSKH